MYSNPLVTALLCNYNYGRYLAEAIESVLAQSWKKLEVIVVDDGSTDESRAVLEKYEGKIRIFLKDNGGQASAFNMGLAEARGDLICFLDSDDVWYRNRVSRVVEKYKEGQWGLVCHDLNLIDDVGNSIKNTWSHYAGVNMIEGDFRDVVLKNNYSWVFSPTSGMSLPKSLAEKIFPIPCEKWKISADEPLAFSAAYLHSVGVISETLGAYRLHGKNLFATFHDDMDARRIAGLTHTTRRYFFYKEYLTEYSNDLPHPKNNYHYYRSCCFIAREKPYLYILALLAKNIRYHLPIKKNILIIAFNIATSFAVDLLVLLRRKLQKSSKYNLLNRRFKKESFNIAADQLRYILYDD